MRLLHLSDIHFRSPECLNPRLDPDVPFRSRLQTDLVEMCNKDGIPVDAILVGGDIAYKGVIEEYAVAKEWLLRIASLCGCSTSGIFTVPGNHDVDRSLCSNVGVSNAQEAIAREVSPFDRDAQLSRQLSYAQSGLALFQPMGAYNEFAAQFGCNVFPERPFWEREVEIENGVMLRLFGLTSTLISGRSARDDAPGRLFLGSAQTVLNPQEDFVNLVLCHHPPNWFIDSSRADNLINARAQLQFFGHEHDQRCIRPPEYFRFLAGAVNPVRDEPAWRPGYNLVDLKVDGTGLERAINVQAHIRQFQSAPNELFVPLLTQNREEIWRHKLRIPQLAAFHAVSNASNLKAPPQSETKIASAVHLAVQENAVQSPERPPLHPSQPTEDKVLEPSTDNLVFRFWQLSTSQMRDIALELGLITNEDLKLPPHERYYKALETSRKKGLLIELAKSIEKCEKKT